MKRQKKQSLLWSKPEKFSGPELILHLVLAWMLAVMLEILILPVELRSLAGLQGLAQMDLGRVVLLTLFGTGVLFLVSRFANVAFLERCGVLFAFTVIAVLTLQASGTRPYLVVCGLLFVILLVFLAKGWNKSEEGGPVEAKKLSTWLFGALTALLAVAFVLFVSAWTVGRYLTFSAPTFDFGIFAQMFHNMKESGLPMTTVERDGMLSHFAVHVSPIYYLMLPFYALFPSPITLQVLQAVVIASAVIPMWLLGKRHGLNPVLRMVLCAVLLLYPALSGGTSYDIHENCFLAPLVLWVFYGIDRKSTVITAISSVLVLMVKEDAAMYIAVIALWLIVKSLLRYSKAERKNLLTGLAMLAGSLIWFFAVTSYLAKSGDGVMTYRYSNFMYDGSDSLATVVKSVILNPMKALYECVDPEKLKFISLTLLPLLGLPLITRRYERFILLIPYLLVNLMSDYQYQHDIFFQYTFGSTAFLFYLTAVNLSDLKLNRIRAIPLVLAGVVTAGCFVHAIVPTAVDFPKRAMEKREYYDTIREALDTIPEGVPASATSAYTAYLSDREILYDVRHSSKEHVLETEYIAINVTSTSYYKKYATDGKNNGYSNFVKLLEENGYVCDGRVAGVLEIYYKP